MDAGTGDVPLTMNATLSLPNDFDRGIEVTRSLARSAGRIGNTIDRLVLLCYHYDASRGRYAPAAINIMRLGGGLTVLILGGWMLAQWTREQRRRRAVSAAAHV